MAGAARGAPSPSRRRSGGAGGSGAPRGPSPTLLPLLPLGAPGGPREAAPRLLRHWPAVTCCPRRPSGRPPTPGALGRSPKDQPGRDGSGGAERLPNPCANPRRDPAQLARGFRPRGLPAGTRRGLDGQQCCVRPQATSPHVPLGNDRQEGQPPPLGTAVRPAATALTEAPPGAHPRALPVRDAQACRPPSVLACAPCHPAPPGRPGGGAGQAPLMPQCPALCGLETAAEQEQGDPPRPVTPGTGCRLQVPEAGSSSPCRPRPAPGPWLGSCHPKDQPPA